MTIAMSAPEGLELDGDELDAEVASSSLQRMLMRLVWVCGDCGEHYPRRQGCPSVCHACGAPRENFFAPVED